MRQRQSFIALNLEVHHAVTNIVRAPTHRHTGVIFFEEVRVTALSVVDIFAGAEPIGTSLVRGWVRTRRDSKAGLSFIHLHDGSCFAPIQIVAPNTLANYSEDVQRISAGCSIDVTGVLATSEGKGQSIEIIAEEIQVIGWVEEPESYPMQPKRHSVEYLRQVVICGRGQI